MKVATLAIVLGGFALSYYCSFVRKQRMPDLVLLNVEAIAKPEGSYEPCPNGCKGDGDGCYCNGWYGDYAEDYDGSFYY